MIVIRQDMPDGSTPQLWVGQLDNLPRIGEVISVGGSVFDVLRVTNHVAHNEVTIFVKHYRTYTRRIGEPT